MNELTEYLLSPIPHPSDGVADAVVAAYRRASSPRRREMETRIDHRTAQILCIRGERLAAEAVRGASPEPLRRALVALGLAQLGLLDHRTNLVPMAAVDNSANMVGVSLSMLLDEVSGDLPEPAVVALRAFDGRKERNRSLRAMGLRTDGAGETFRYASD
jgi:hypothetical protein